VKTDAQAGKIIASTEGHKRIADQPSGKTKVADISSISPNRQDQ